MAIRPGLSGHVRPNLTQRRSLLSAFLMELVPLEKFQQPLHPVKTDFLNYFDRGLRAQPTDSCEALVHSLCHLVILKIEYGTVYPEMCLRCLKKSNKNTHLQVSQHPYYI